MLESEGATGLATFKCLPYACRTIGEEPGTGPTRIFYLNSLKINLNYRNGLKTNLFSQTA
jgi:hypothetical protein